MAKFESKSTILTKKLNNIIYELLVKTTANMVYVDDDTTLVETLSDIGDILTTHTQSFNEMMNQIVALVAGASTMNDSIQEIWDYINIDGEPKSALIKMINSKVTSIEGKGLSSCDFTDVLKEKLENDYTKEELTEKFRIITEQMKVTSGDTSTIVERVEKIENSVNVKIVESDEDLGVVPNGTIYFRSL